MKILILSQYFWPQNYRINLIAKELILKKYDVTVLTSSTKEKLNNEFIKAKVYRVKTYQVKNFRLIEILLNYFTFYVSATLFIIFNYKKLKVDKVLIFQPSPIFIGLLGILIKKLTKAQIYLWVLDLWPDTVFDYNFVKKKSFFGKALSFITRRIYENCEKIFIHSKPFVSQVKKYTDRKCIFLPTPAEDIFNSSNKHIYNKKFINILFAGNIGQSQSFNDILRALSLKEFKNIKLTILGDGRRINELQALIKNNKNNNVIYRKRVPIKEVNKYYEKTDFFFISLININTFRKTVPGKFQSYLKFGKPILGVINGETNKIIKEFKCGYSVNNGEFNRLIEVLVKIQKLNQLEYNKFCKNSLRAYKKNYDKKLIIDRLVNNLKFTQFIK